MAQNNDGYTVLFTLTGFVPAHGPSRTLGGMPQMIGIYSSPENAAKRVAEIEEQEVVLNRIDVKDGLVEWRISANAEWLIQPVPLDYIKGAK